MEMETLSSGQLSYTTHSAEYIDQRLKGKDLCEEQFYVLNEFFFQFIFAKNHPSAAIT